MKRPPIPPLDDTLLLMPDKIMDNRSFQGPKPYEENPWDKWIQGLELGQSFVVDNYNMQYVRRKAKEFDIDIVWEPGPEPFTKRVWIYGTENYRNPIYRRLTSTKIIEVHRSGFEVHT